jgi:hypothetical protein
MRTTTAATTPPTMAPIGAVVCLVTDVEGDVGTDDARLGDVVRLAVGVDDVDGSVHS